MKSRSHSRSKSPQQRQREQSISETKEQSRRKSSRESSPIDNPGNNLYISNLSYRIKDEDIQGVFQKFGNLVYCKVIKDPKSNLSRGFGFVTFKNSEEADKALEELNNQEVFGRKITIQKARRGRPYEPTPGKYLGKNTNKYERRFEEREWKRSNSRERSHRYSRYSPRRRSPGRYRNNSPQYNYRSSPGRRSPKRRSRSPRNRYQPFLLS